MNIKTILLLIFVNMIYASVTLFTKEASLCSPMSFPYIACIGGAVCMLGIYAILWQQILKNTDLSLAYMFKATAVIFVLMISCIFFKEILTVHNIIGAALLIIGITLYSYQPKKV